LPVLDFTRKELTVMGSRNNAGQFAAAVELVRRHRDVVRRLVTHRFPFEAAGDAMAFALEHPAATGKVLITVDGTR
jgi:threonine dehydrogenase-like Zn-dependent dehydrogenase